MIPEPKPSALAAAVVEAMKRVRYVKETGKNDFHGYKYASDEDFLILVQPALADVGLCLLPSVTEVRTVEHSADKKGAPRYRTELVQTWELLHVSGESRMLSVPACGLDSEDKGTYKALTGALKYLVRHLLLIPTGADPERVRGDEGDAQPGHVPIQAPATLPARKGPPPQGAVNRSPGEVDLDSYIPSETGKERLAAWGTVEQVRELAAWLGMAVDPFVLVDDPAQRDGLIARLTVAQADVECMMDWADAYRAALHAARLTPSAVDQWAMATGRPRAARMPREQRQKLLDFVKTPGGAAKIAGHHINK
jgi:hypothetical protein